jgi:hypothetical protein
MTKWAHIQTYDEYYDFDKELFAMPDDGRTSIDMRLTFNVERSDCYYQVLTHNDSGNTFELGDTFDIPWTVGLAMLTADGIDIPEALKEKAK